MLTMQRTLTTLPLLASLMIGACVRYYEPPLPNEPHAIVKIRRAYHATAGETLSETASVADGQVMSNTRAASLEATQTTAVRVHPGPLQWQVSSDYSHTVTQRVQETYYEQQPYTATETYNCGSYSSSGSSSYQSCSRQVTHYRQVAKQRWVNKTVVVSDGGCRAGLSQLAEAGHVYLLQYSYTGPGVCSLQCIEQIPNPTGGFGSRPCPPAPRS